MEAFERPAKMRRRGSLKFFKTKSGSHVIVLPNCSVSPHVLIEDNWSSAARNTNFGIARRIRLVDKLSDGSEVIDSSGKKATLWAKAPETIFYRKKHGGPWIFGFVEEDKVVSLRRDIRAQKQAMWEARILLSLLKKGKKAEIPQAIVIHPNGTREVITKGITEQFSKGISKREVTAAQRSVALAGFVPIDLEERNLLVDERGSPRIIDVNRWEFPPHTDTYIKRLVAAIEEAAEKKK